MLKPELEQTLVLFKPDALKQSLTGYLFTLLSEFHTDLRYAATKIVTVHDMLAQEHYAEHKGKPFFPSLLQYISGQSHYPDEVWKRRVIALVYQGVDAVQKIRAIAGPTDPLVAREKKPGCIRALGARIPVRDANGTVIDERMDNLIHASASIPEAEREVKLWFKPYDIPAGMRAFAIEECDTHYYYLNNKLYTEHIPNSVCIMAPSDAAWRSDLQALRLLLKGEPAECSLAAVVAKYLINA